jgi:hypothetical protein
MIRLFIGWHHHTKGRTYTTESLPMPSFWRSPPWCVVVDSMPGLLIHPAPRSKNEGKSPAARRHLSTRFEHKLCARKLGYCSCLECRSYRCTALYVGDWAVSSQRHSSSRSDLTPIDDQTGRRPISIFNFVQIISPLRMVRCCTTTIISMLKEIL